MWELPLVPDAWHPALQIFDALAARSPFIRQSFDLSVPDARVIDARLFLPMRSEAIAQRRRFGLESDLCYCITSFEPFSEIRRKNIKAVVAAFQAAVAAAPNMRLIIKVNNAATDGIEHPDLMLLRDSISGVPGVQLIADTLSHPDLLSLFASCDIYVSLHRSEGFGLGISGLPAWLARRSCARQKGPQQLPRYLPLALQPRTEPARRKKSLFRRVVRKARAMFG